jgi:hypothetical protein
MTLAAAPRTVGEIDSFITMLRTACSDRTVNKQLERLLALPDAKRQALVHAWVGDLLVAKAPQGFIQAVACLADDRIAEKAFEVIYQCSGNGAASGIIAPGAAKRPHAPQSPVRRTVLLAILAAVLSLIAWWLWPQAKIRTTEEIAPVATLRIRTPEIKAYEDAWWADARARLEKFCSGLPIRSAANHAFVVNVDADGRIIRVDVSGELTPLVVELKQVLAPVKLPAFTPDQRAQKKSLALRGNLFIDDGRCRLQRA